MIFIVIEIQTYTDGTIGTLVNSYNNFRDAEIKYHTVLSAAAISDLPKHACVVLGNDGEFILNKCYIHDEAVTELVE